METNRERAARPEGSASIRLHYSTQLQINGRMHTIDAEISLPVGVSQEMREQIIRETEMSVEQLARQIRQRGTKSVESSRVQAPASLRPAPNTTAATPPASGNSWRAPGEPASLPVSPSASGAPLPTAQGPVSESMPTAPATRAEGKTVTLANFLNVIKKRWDMSGKEAMDLLHLEALDGQNYRELYAQLEEIMKRKAGTLQAQQQSTRPTQSMPVVESPRQSSKTTPPLANSRQPASQSGTSTPGTRAQSQAVHKEVTGIAAQHAPGTPASTEKTLESRQKSGQRLELEPGRNFAGSPKAPIPIHLGVEVVHDTSTQSYQFDEEEIEEFEDDEQDEEDYQPPEDREQERASARLKLDRLAGIRGGQTVSADRLKVLDTLIDSQLSEEQLQTIIQAAWGTTNKKKLKNVQVEELISWAKEDYFVEEAESMLELIAGGED